MGPTAVGMLSDPTLKWLEPTGLSQDLTKMGMGVRAKRFALVIDDLKVTYLGVCEFCRSLVVEKF